MNGFDISRSRSSAQRCMGLCPQFDTLIERLTVVENLQYFGRIKGIDSSNLVSVCDTFMNVLNIKRYQHKAIMNLSGGNRRKVSLAVALLGAPPTVYLDEPSTGLDPVASRLMWRLLTKITAKAQSAIILTTHNMIECEAVCTRIGVMKNGELVCLGDSQHLRSAHGTGFLLEINLSHFNAAPAAVEFVTNTFRDAKIIDEHITMINFEIPRTSIDRLSSAFAVLQNNKERLQIVDYSFSQSTLEQVFLKQIRPNNEFAVQDQDQAAINGAVKLTWLDLIMAYFAWLLSFFLPGFYRLYLGDYLMGVFLMLTFNFMYLGWIYDFFQMPELVRISKKKYGNTFTCVSLKSLCSFFNSSNFNYYNSLRVAVASRTSVFAVASQQKLFHLLLCSR